MTIRSLAALLIIHFCVSSAPAAPSDATASKLLVGSWVNRGRYRSLSDTRTWIFRANGTFSFCTVLRSGDAEAQLQTLGKWRIRDGVLIQEVTGGTEGTHVGSIMRHILLSIDEKRVHFRTQWGEEPAFTRKLALGI